MLAALGRRNQQKKQAEATAAKNDAVKAVNDVVLGKLKQLEKSPGAFLDLMPPRLAARLLWESQVVHREDFVVHTAFCTFFLLSVDRSGNTSSAPEDSSKPPSQRIVEQYVTGRLNPVMQCIKTFPFDTSYPFVRGCRALRMVMKKAEMTNIQQCLVSNAIQPNADDLDAPDPITPFIERAKALEIENQLLPTRWPCLGLEKLVIKQPSNTRKKAIAVTELVALAKLLEKTEAGLGHGMGKKRGLSLTTPPLRIAVANVKQGRRGRPGPSPSIPPTLPRLSNWTMIGTTIDDDERSRGIFPRMEMPDLRTLTIAPTNNPIVHHLATVCPNLTRLDLSMPAGGVGGGGGFMRFRLAPDTLPFALEEIRLDGFVVTLPSGSGMQLQRMRRLDIKGRFVTDGDVYPINAPRLTHLTLVNVEPRLTPMLQLTRGPAPAPIPANDGAVPSTHTLDLDRLTPEAGVGLVSLTLGTVMARATLPHPTLRCLSFTGNPPTYPVPPALLPGLTRIRLSRWHEDYSWPALAPALTHVALTDAALPDPSVVPHLVSADIAQGTVPDGVNVITLSLTGGIMPRTGPRLRHLSLTDAMVDLAHLHNSGITHLSMAGCRVTATRRVTLPDLQVLTVGPGSTLETPPPVVKTETPGTCPVPTCPAIQRVYIKSPDFMTWVYSTSVAPTVLEADFWPTPVDPAPRLPCPSIAFAALPRALTRLRIRGVHLDPIPTDTEHFPHIARLDVIVGGRQCINKDNTLAPIERMDLAQLSRLLGLIPAVREVTVAAPEPSCDEYQKDCIEQMTRLYDHQGVDLAALSRRVTVRGIGKSGEAVDVTVGLTLLTHLTVRVPFTLLDGMTCPFLQYLAYGPPAWDCGTYAANGRRPTSRLKHDQYGQATYHMARPKMNVPSGVFIDLSTSGIKVLNFMNKTNMATTLQYDDAKLEAGTVGAYVRVPDEMDGLAPVLENKRDSRDRYEQRSSY